MRITLKKDITPALAAEALAALFENISGQGIVPTAMNIYVSFRDKDTGKMMEPKENQWEIMSEPYCHTDKKLLFADADRHLYIYRLDTKKEEVGLEPAEEKGEAE